jgi:hypothetical protein
MRVKTGILIVATALLCVACASAGAPPPGLDDDDRDDGPPGPVQQLFISPAGKPFRAEPGQPYPVSTWFAEADRDRVGRLTRDEFRADASAWFKALDVDGDGRIDMPEATRWEDVLVPETTRSGAGRALTQRGRRFQPLGRNELDTYSQGAAPYSLINEPHPIRGADADLSYSVSADEFRAAADRRFAVLDVDGDGVTRLIDLKPTAAQGRSARPR